MIEFKTLNFLTGQNAAGKSTIIDALQVVMLGETRSHIFNKAANDKSERTLIGYLKGELGDDGETGFRYLREGDFNAYIALEFYDTVKDKSFISGIVFDVYGDGTQKNSFFIADCEIPDNQFLSQGIPMNRSTLKQLLNHHSNKKFSFYDSQSVYRQHLMAKCGNIKHKFFGLFKKAVPFSPISDIESFITEYITDIKGKPDIEEMQQNLRYYKRLEKDAEAVQDRIIKLESIDKTHQDYTTKMWRQILHEGITSLGQLKSYTNHLDHLTHVMEDNNQQFLEISRLIEEHSSKKYELETLRDTLIMERAQSDVQSKLEALTQQIEQEETKIRNWLSQFNETVMRFNSLAQSYLEHQDQDQNRNNNQQLAQYCMTLTVSSLKPSTVDQIKSFNDVLVKWNAFNQKIMGDLKAKELEITKQLKELETTLSDLEKGIKPFPLNVIKLKQLLESKGIGQVTILSEVLEVTELRWKNVIEGYLHTQKFYLFVDEVDFEEALKIYDAEKNKQNLFDVGLVDVARLRKQQPQAREKSLACLVTTAHEGARIFIDFVLGNVMTCDSLVELRNHSIGITESGMLYQNYVARQLNPERWRVPYIGRNSVESQIEMIKSQLFIVKGNKVELDDQITAYTKKCEIAPLSDFELNAHVEGLSRLNDFGFSQEKIQKLSKERDSLDLTYLSQLDKKIEITKRSIFEIDANLMAYSSDKGKVEGEINRLKVELIPNAQMQLDNQKALVDSDKFDQVRDEAMTRFEKLILDLQPDQISINYSRSAKAAGTDKDNIKKELIKKREDYNRTYHMSHDAYAESNHLFEQALITLKESNLPEYASKIKDAKEKTYEQFKDEFLAKLKENIDTVFAQIKELNSAIKDSPFGTDNYRFEVKPKSEMRVYYDMIMDELLLKDSMSILSYAFNQKHHDAIDELFRMIVNVSDEVSSEQRAMLEKNIAYYTDYRSYLNFDLIVKDQNGDEQRLSKTLLKKSGGETQTPFYLSVLASFAHMYRIAHSGTSSETIRLIVFDEAFSKMDQQRIEESLRLLRKFNLQAIISAPPDKIVDITPHVDQNLCVFRSDNISFVKGFEKKELMEV
jgi:energy-coupling factor transporter ATP-binding protein EcfA2